MTSLPIIPCLDSLPNNGVPGNLVMVRSKLYFHNGREWVKLATEVKTPETRWVLPRNNK